MPSEITSANEVQLTGTVADVKGKGKERSENIAVESAASHSMTISSHTIDTNVERMDIPLGTPSVIASSHTPLPPHLASEAVGPSPHRPHSRPSSRDNSPYPRSRPSTPNRTRPSTPTTTSSPSGLPRPPPRRSQRTLTKAPSRPLGPPELEAALAIAIRNLESDIFEWWCANQKPGSPIPTTAYLKGRSPRIRRAAEAVDEADRLLNEAIYGKPRKPRGPAKKYQVPADPDPQLPLSNASPGDIPETAFEQLELNSQGNSPLPSANPIASAIPVSNNEQSGNLTRGEATTDGS